MHISDQRQFASRNGGDWCDRKEVSFQKQDIVKQLVGEVTNECEEEDFVGRIGIWWRWKEEISGVPCNDH